MRNSSQNNVKKQQAIYPALQYLKFVLLGWLLILICQPALAKTATIASKSLASPAALQCVAFSPYVGTLSPDYGAKPSRELIDTLLDKLIQNTPFRCIMTYGVLNGLDYVLEAAQARNLKVIAILWIDKDPMINSQSISRGIALAREFKHNIVMLSCGSEVRTRHGYQFDGEISRCLLGLREAGLQQPITTIDTWWEWCNRKMPCETSRFGAEVDWIGVNIYPWWDNNFSGLFPCTTAERAAGFHMDRLEDLHHTYPGKTVVLTEFGWPSGPPNATTINRYNKQRCGIASPQNQQRVIRETFKQLAKKHWSGVVFEAFTELWKPDSEEGNSGRYWGICQGEAPYDCPNLLLGKHK